MKSEKFLIIYSFLACLFLMVVGIFSARSTNQLLNSFIYLPLVFFFGTRIFRQLSKQVVRQMPQPSKIPEQNQPTDPVIVKGIADKDKRLFLQLIGTTGFSILLMSLFSQRARNTFLGGGGSPEVTAIKDVAGNTINPSEKLPTDGYSITDIDDDTMPGYYAFVKSNGAWYIMQNTSGTFRYAKGSGNYSSNWEVRSKLHYDYYNNVFS